MKLDLRATDLNVSHEITTKSPTSFSSSSSSSGTASGQLCSLSIHSLNSSTSDGDAKSPMFGISTQNVALSGAGEEITDLFVSFFCFYLQYILVFHILSQFSSLRILPLECKSYNVKDSLDVDVCKACTM